MVGMNNTEHVNAQSLNFTGPLSTNETETFQLKYNNAVPQLTLKMEKPDKEIFEKVEKNKFVEEVVKIPKKNEVLDFLSAAGKIATIMLAVTPLPTYLGVWGKSKSEQTQRVQSISFNYLLLCLLCNSIWTSYAFKT